MRPEEAKRRLEPFEPGRDGSWDTAAAAHLARRATFGASAELVAGLLARTPAEAARSLIQADDDSEGLRVVAEASRRVGSREAAQNAWMHRMLASRSPAREKLALFWHGHFATSDEKVEDARLLMKQIELFRARGAGSFPELLLEVSRDPAMIRYLDNNSNRRGRPNENYARELMELFSLGIGNYTEDDIKEAARAFTGWHERRGEFRFNERAHDRDEKTVFGKTGRFGGEDIVALCTERPVCSRFIAGKLFEFYVRLKPEAELVNALGELYERCGQETGAFLERLWSSREFFDSSSRRALVASPVEFVVGAFATLGAKASAEQLVKAATRMGQEILAPPSVKGWDPGLAWLSSNTILARLRFAAEATTGSLAEEIPWSDLERLGADSVIARFFPEGLDADVRRDLDESADGDFRLTVAGCLELPEAQYT